MITKGQTVYYARIVPNVGMYYVVDLKIRTIEKDWFCGTDSITKQAFLFDNEDLNNIVFINRKDALKLVKEAEKNKSNINTETFYEEY